MTSTVVSNTLRERRLKGGPVALNINGARGAAIVSAGIVLSSLTMAAAAHASPDSEPTASEARASEATASEATGSASARGPQRSVVAKPGRQAGPGPRAGSARGAVQSTVGEDGLRRERNAGASPAAAQSARRAPRVSEPPAITGVAPKVVAEPDTGVAPTPVLNSSAPAALSPLGLTLADPVAAPSSPSAAVTLAKSPAVPQPAGLVGSAPPAATAAADALARGLGAPLQSALAWTMLAAARNEVGRRSAVPGAAVLASMVTNSPLVQPVGQAVSPLGTPEQIAAEAAAMQTVRTLPVLAMKAVLNIAWRIIGGIQYSQVGGPDKANLAVLSQAVDEWAMGTGFQLLILNSNEPTIVTQVMPPHQWYGLDVTGSRILYDNPDTIYRFTGVNYASEYVITGRLPERDPQASFSVLTGTTGSTAAVLNGDQLELGPDRTFVITVSGDPAAPGEKNHLQITPDTTLIAIRDTLSDWNLQDPMNLAIHRTAGPPNSLFSQFGGFAIPKIGPLVAQSAFLTALASLIPPLPFVPPIVRGAYASLLMLRGISQEALYIKVATTDPVTGKTKAPNVFTDPTSNASFLATQLQSAGYFQLADDEAMVLTINPNNAGYFVAPVTDDWTITGNYWNEQTSLNNAQARPNPDGSYTLVVSPTQPMLAGDTSVWNWVSTGGLNQGTMAIRFQSIDPNNPTKPTVSSQVVPLSELASVLPAGTVVVTPAERAVQIAARKEGFNRRFAPYPQG